MDYPEKPEEPKKKSSGGVGSWFKSIGTAINVAQTTVTTYQTTKTAAK